MEVDDEPDRNIEQFHVAEELSIVDGDDVLDTLQSPVARHRARGRCRTARGSQVRRGG